MYHPKSSFDLLQECLSHMRSNGIPFDGPLKCDGEIHRFSIDAKKNQPDEWYIRHEEMSEKGNPLLVCTYGTWSRRQERFIYKSYEANSTLSQEELSAIKTRMEERRQLQELQRKEDLESRIKGAQEKWDQSMETATLPGHSMYLQRKQVKAYGIRYRVLEDGTSVVVIPLCNVEGQLQAVQCIDENGIKKVHGAKKGNFHILGVIEDNSRIYVAEGYATAASIYEVTKCPTVFAVDCGNLQPVIANLRVKYPHNEIIIATDNDVETSGNPGKTKAEEAAKAHVCKVVIPTFPEDFKLHNSKPATDFNDLHVHFGLDKVKEQLEPTAQLVSTPQIHQSNGFQFRSAYSLIQKPPKANWLIKSYLDMGSLAVLFGEPGSMKSFLAIDMGYCIATGKEWHGNPVRKSGPVFYIAGEGFAGLSKRLRAWSLAKGIDLEGIPFFISNRPTQLLDPGSTSEVIRSIDELKDKHGLPVFVVIDTLNRNFGSGDENNTEDMTAFIQSIDMAIRTRYGCSVLIIHHTPLNDPKRARGASALRGALDWEYCLSKHTGDVKKLSATKVKDYELPQEIHFKPKPIPLEGWIDQEDGEIMTSCVLEKVKSSGDKLNLPKLQGAQKVAYDCLFKLLESNPEGVLVDDWKKKAYEANISPSGTLDANKKAFQRAVNMLRANGYVQVNNDLWNLCGTGDRERTFEGHVSEEYGDKRDMCL